MKKPFDEFLQDMKEMIKTKDMNKVSKKYLKPALETAKQVCEKTCDFVEENTPKMIDATKEVCNKTTKIINKMKETSLKNKNKNKEKYGDSKKEKNMNKKGKSTKK